MYSILFERGELPLKKYITTRFSGGKLDFSLIDDTHGFSLIDNENQNEFIDSFRKFEELDWNAIATDNGLDYKTYNKNKKSKRYFSDEQWKKGIKKFRITQRNRCFGYVDNGIFRLTHRNQEGQEGICCVSQESNTGWVLNVSIFNLHQALRKHRKCRNPYQKSDIKTS